jgi:hypothetical protein
MNRRPPHEPSRHFPQPQRLWDDPTRHPPSLGCPTCLERDRCGGVHTDAGIVDCRDLCSCKDKSKCDMVCRFNPRLFVARMREVSGLGFENAPRAPANGVPDLPTIVPFVDHRYGRVATLDEPVVALSLYELVNLATGRSHVASRAELADRFRIPESATIIVSGVDKDGPIERWWELKERAAILDALGTLGIALVTTPNYKCRVAAARRQTHDCGRAASALGRHRPDRCRAPRWPRWPAAPSRRWATRKSAADFRRRGGPAPLVRHP